MQNKPAAGVGFFGLLTLLLIGLKLTGSIGVSWLWVLAPIWAPFLLAFLLVVFVVLVSSD